MVDLLGHARQVPLQRDQRVVDQLLLLSLILLLGEVAPFGTKFEGLQVSFDLPKQVEGLFHAGSVGIIMSGWLGAANYGVIVANKADSFITAVKR